MYLLHAIRSLLWGESHLRITYSIDAFTIDIHQIYIFLYFLVGYVPGGFGKSVAGYCKYNSLLTDCRQHQNYRTFRFLTGNFE